MDELETIEATFDPSGMFLPLIVSPTVKFDVLRLMFEIVTELVAVSPVTLLATYLSLSKEISGKSLTYKTPAVRVPESGIIPIKSVSISFLFFGFQGGDFHPSLSAC